MPSLREKHEDQDQAEPEVGDRAGQHAVAEQHLVGDAAALDCGVDADRDAERDREQSRAEHQLERRRQALLDVLEHALRGPPRAPEIALHDVTDVDQILLVERAIEAEIAAHLLDPLLGRELAGHQECRVARQQPDQKEHDDRDREQLRDQEQEAPPGVSGKPHDSSADRPIRDRPSADRVRSPLRAHVADHRGRWSCATQRHARVTPRP